MAVGPFSMMEQEPEELQVESHDSYDKSTTVSAPQYTPLYYQINDVNLTGPGTLAHPMKGLDYGPILEFSSDLRADLEFTIDGSVLTVADIAVLKEHRFQHAANDYQCTRMSGHFDTESKRCTSYQ